MTKFFLTFLFIFNNIAFSQTSDEQFNTFFQNFKDAVKNEKVTEIAEFINFPFHSFWGNGENWITKESFLANAKYHTVIPKFVILSKAEFNKETRVIDQGSTIDVNFRFDNSSYIISYFDVSEEEGDQAEYCFTLQNGEYRYSKMINSAMYGPPYELDK